MTISHKLLFLFANQCRNWFCIFSFPFLFARHIVLILCFMNVPKQFDLVVHKIIIQQFVLGVRIKRYMRVIFYFLKSKSMCKSDHQASKTYETEIEDFRNLHDLLSMPLR